MSATLQLSISATRINPAIGAASSQVDALKDVTASAHDYVDPCPMAVATAGATGTTFVPIQTSVVRGEAFYADLGASADIVLRFSGAVASVLGSVSVPALAAADTLVLSTDGGAQVTTTFAGTENTVAKVAGAIAQAFLTAGLPNPAGVDVATGFLRLSGVKTGGQGANALGWQYGQVVVVSGAAVAKLGLAVGTTWGAGRDLRVGPPYIALRFSASDLPTKFEVSGTAPNCTFTVAGKAS